MDSAQWWLNNGVSIAMLAAIAVGCYYSGRWIGANFLAPVRDRILRFVDLLENAQRQMIAHDARAAEILERLKEMLAAIKGELREVSSSCVRTEEHMELMGLRRRRRRPKPPSDPPHPRPAT